jgi:hypothetical protein
MLKKIKKIPSYLKGINKRINKIGFFKTINNYFTPDFNHPIAVLLI